MPADHNSASLFPVSMAAFPHHLRSSVAADVGRQTRKCTEPSGSQIRELADHSAFHRPCLQTSCDRNLNLLKQSSNNKGRGEKFFPFTQLGRTKWPSPHLWVLLLPVHWLHFLLLRMGFLLLPLGCSSHFFLFLCSQVSWNGSLHKMAPRSLSPCFPEPSQTRYCPTTLFWSCSHSRHRNLRMVPLGHALKSSAFWASLVHLLLLALSPSHVSMQSLSCFFLPPWLPLPGILYWLPSLYPSLKSCYSPGFHPQLSSLFTVYIFFDQHIHILALIATSEWWRFITKLDLSAEFQICNWSLSPFQCPKAPGIQHIQLNSVSTPFP